MAYHISSGVISSRVTLYHDSMYISSGGVANSTTINGSRFYGGCMYIYNGGVANSTTINSGGSMRISSGGVANSTTVNYLGEMYIHSGGVANSTTVNSGGDMMIWSGGMANSTTINSGGYMTIWYGGTATNIIWTPCIGHVSVEDGAYVTYASNYYGVYFGSNNQLLSHTATMTEKVLSGHSMYVMSGGTANSTTVDYYGSMHISSGGVANSATVYSGGEMRISSGGVANSTTVNSRGSITISSGGTANSTTVNSGGRMHIYSGGTATNISWTPCIGYVSAADGAYVTYASTYSGVYFGLSDQLLSHTESMTGKFLSGHSMYVMSGGVANTTTVNCGGEMSISSGGTANSTTVFYGYMYISSGGMANSTTVSSGGYMYISSGGVANSTTVYYEGSMCIGNSGVANSTTVNYLGEMYIHSGGVANSTTVSSSGRMYILSGGMHRGSLQIESGAVVSAYSGGKIDFTVAERTASDGYLISNLSRISGTPTYTITVSATQAEGTYKLAHGAANFNKTISIGDGTTNYGSITVNGVILSNNGIDYRLTQESGNLILEIGDMSPPGAPTATASTTAPTNQNVTVTATFSSDSTVKQYKIGNGSWINYTAPFTVSANATISLRAQDAAGNESTGSLIISNIDKVAPTAPTAAASTTAPTNQNVTVTATFSSDSTVKQYKIGYGNWINYTGAFTVSDNTTVSLRAEDAAGNESTGSLVIANIDKVAPTMELSADKTTPTNQDVVLTATVSDGTVEYYNGSAWVAGSSLTVSKNGTYQFRVTDAAGNMVERSIEVSNIDKVAPTAPTATASTTAPTNRDVTVTATFSSDSTVKQYKIGDGNWTNYTAPFAVSANATIALRAQDAAGNESTGSLIIANIDKVPPVITISCDDTMPYADLIHLTANVTESNLASTEYAIGSGSWQTYTAPVEINANGTIHFRATDTAGNVTVSSYAVTNIGNGEVKIYSSGVLSSRSPIASGKTLTSIHRMDIYSSGIANSTIINSGGVMNIYNRGTANCTTVNSGGDMYISRGTANSTTMYGGAMQITSGGIANSTIINSGGVMNIYNSGAANSATVHSGGSMYISSGGAASNTIVHSGGDMNILSGGVANNTTVSGGSMRISSGGAANSTTVHSGGSMYISNGGAASNTTVNADGVFLLSSGGSAVNLTLSRYASASISDAFISNLNMASRASAAITNGLIGGVVINSSAILQCSVSDRNHFMTLSGGTVYSNGKIIASSGAAVSNVTVSKAGTLHLENGGQAYATLIREEGIFTMLGVANSTTLHGGSMYVGDSSYQNYDGTGGNPTSNVYDEDIHASNNTLNSSWLHVYSGGTATNNVVNSNSWLHVYYGGTATSNVINSSGYITVQDSGTADTAFVHSGGFMRLYTGAILKGEVNVGGKVTVHTAGTSATEDVIRAYGAKIDYLVSERTVQDESIITNLGMIMGATFFATVKSDQTAGIYSLADGAGDFDGNITIRNESGTVYGTLSVNGDDITHNGVTYSLDQADGNLTLTISEPAPGVSNLTGNANGVSWSGNASTFAVEYSKDNFANVLQLETVASAVDTYQIGAGSWKVRVDSEAQTSFTAAVPTGSAAQIVSDADGDLDVFFARTAGTWTSRHAARHAAPLNGWRGTNERVALTGKNIITDVFAGSSDANILVLTDDANGDALFLDDAFTALGNQARLGNIDEIRAGAGNDVIDLTSPKFAYLGDEMTVFGGAGDDTIWANSGENTLYGDAGNDRIIGGAGNDFIIGGAGNDVLHGGGGNDTFCFGANWGTDTVEQLANGKVILRFETGSMNNWNAASGIYSDGNNTVTVTGSGDIELYFGTASTLPEDAFAPAASEKIFENIIIN